MRELPVRDATDQRILGSLLEKQTTVPATYPLSANALVSACNQTSSRDPVTDLDQQIVERTAKSLKERGLLRIVWSDTGRRTLKYHQILDEHLVLEPDERALLTVLLLRGAQAPGELRTRTERLHGFADRGRVEECLRRMASRPQPLVCELERRPGQQDPRWIHLLGAASEQTSGETGSAWSADSSRIRVTQIIADLHVPDLPASRSFYSDYLGLAEEEFNLGWVARHTSPVSRATLQVMTSDAPARGPRGLGHGRRRRGRLPPGAGSWVRDRASPNNRVMGRDSLLRPRSRWQRAQRRSAARKLRPWSSAAERGRADSRFITDDGARGHQPGHLGA